MTVPRVILVADDDPVIRMILRATFESPNAWTVVEADDGPHALEMLATYHPALVLLDLRMPGLDGLGVCQEIKSDPASRETVVIVVTGLRDPEAEQRARAAGADGFLVKPFSPRALLELVDSLLPAVG